MTTDTTPQERIEAAIEQLGLTFEYKFVPFSQSRNKTNKSPSLNWLVTLKRGNNSMSFDYSAGCGHCPANKLKFKPNGNMPFDYHKELMKRAIADEWEVGVAMKVLHHSQRPYDATNKKILPKDADIIYSIVLDASAIDSGSFEEWASEFGYDTDSRAAEAVYKACLDTALKLRAIIGDAGLRTLQEACQDY